MNIRQKTLVLWKIKYDNENDKSSVKCAISDTIYRRMIYTGKSCYPWSY